MSLAIFSLLAMAHRQEEDQDRLELKLRKEHCSCGLELAANLTNQRTPASTRLAKR